MIGGDQQPSLLENIRRSLLRRLVRGELVPGDRIDDTALANKFDAKTEMVQSALVELASSGFLQADETAGFTTITPLTMKEAMEAYQILGFLEAQALRLAGAPPAQTLFRLETLNHQLLAASDLPEELVDMDTCWHALLLEGCPNQRLLDLIRNLKDVVVRYEFAYMHDFGMVAGSARVHARVLKELEEGRVDDAAQWLEVNWQDGIKALAKWLEASGER